MTPDKTEMQYPFLDGYHGEDAASDDQNADRAPHDIVDPAHGESSEEVSLANPLRDRFATMRAWLRGNNLSDNHEMEETDLKRKQRQVALETALAIHNEVSRLESAIADLESLKWQRFNDDGQREERDLQHLVPIDNPAPENLLDEEGGSGDSSGLNVVGEAHNNNAIQFPHLPPVVPEQERTEE